MDNNDFEIIVRGSKCVSNFGELKNSTYHILSYSPDLKKVRVRIWVKSGSEKLRKFDPNKLYLVSNELKHRYRPIDLQFKFFLNRYMGVKRLTSDSTLANGMKEKYVADVNYIRYDPYIKDTFKDYFMNGYQDVEFAVDYGSPKKPNKIVVYFESVEVISYFFDIYFLVPASLNMGEFYFGNREIKQCNFNQK